MSNFDRKYVGLTPKFSTMHEMNAYVRFISAPFGPLTDAQWTHLTIHNSKQDAEGRWPMNYDPGSAAPFPIGPIVDP